MAWRSIKLASENKITAKNTWSLALIDHLSDLVKTEKDEDNNTNFQKASCTLDAGVKIYASRVDSVHTETFKVLGGLSRSAQAQPQDEEGDGEEGEEGGEGGGGEDGEGGAKEGGKKGRRGGAPTLEAPEAHTSTQLESAVVVDPLFHKTSAQFDEGGAKGLLMHALSVHRGCDTVFDSDEVPDYGGLTAPGGDTPLGDIVLDCSALAPALARAQAALGGAAGFAGLRFTPALRSLEALMPGAPRRTAAEAAAAPEAPVVDVTAAAAAWADGGLFSCPPAAEEHATSATMFEDDMYTGGDFGGGGFDDDDDEEDSGWHNENAAPAVGAAQGPGGRFRLGNTGVLEWVAAGGAEAVTRHAWAGASHWRFRTAPAAPGSGDAAAGGENGDAAGGAATAKGRKAKKGPFTIDFTAQLPTLDEALFAPPKSKKESTTLVGERTPADTLLPADLRYTARQLTRLFLKPDASPASFGAGADARDDAPAGGPDADAAGAYDDDDGDAGGWGDDGGGWAGEDDTGGYAGPVGDSGAAAQESGLLSAPRRVEKIQVKYARSAKVVDVRALKAALWNGLQAGATRSKDGSVSFGDLLEGVTAACGAGALDDISVHMAFICVLHLANEHGLAIAGAADLETMRVSHVL